MKVNHSHKKQHGSHQEVHFLLRIYYATVLVQSEMEKRRVPLVKIPPLTRRGFSRNKDLSSDAGVPLLFVGAMSPTRLSLSMVASLQSPLLFHLARSL